MGGIGDLFGLTPDVPKPPPVPAMPEQVDVSGQMEYTKQRAKQRKGRKSTILSNLGTQNQQKKTVLG
jgi:hypothetical protein